MTVSEDPRTTIRRHEKYPILLIHDVLGGNALISALEGRRPQFVCTVAYTETAEIDGISAAGATPDLRRLTAAADVEALFFGRPRCMAVVPSNPMGAPGPVIITIAALRLAGIHTLVLDAGLRVKPMAPVRTLSDRWGASIVTGRAVPNAATLFEQGLEIGRELADGADYLLLGESVPGGTTTALALLCALGIDAWGKVSSSMAGNPHEMKGLVARKALTAAGLGDPPEFDATVADPLAIAAAVGDPMQSTVAGLALGAIRRVPVILAGGTQMIAVLALLQSAAYSRGLEVPAGRLGVATTSWVARDPTADLTGLARAVGRAPVIAADLSFAASRHAPLRMYEQFLVKEGVGAGGAAVAAFLATGASRERLTAEIEQVYDEIFNAASP